MTEATPTEASTAKPRRGRRKSKWVVAGERIGGVILALTILALAYGVIWLIRDSNDTSPEPSTACDGQNAETGMSEECKDFIEWLEENPNRIVVTLPPTNDVLERGLMPRS